MSAEPINTLLEAAWRYAHAGLAVFPVSLTKRPLVSQHKATTDIAQIEAWWRQWPDALIGHRIAPDVILLDVDPRHGGKATWDALRAEMDAPDTRAHMSGRGDGGGHTWWQRPAGDLSVKALDAWAKERGHGEQNGGRWSAGIDLLTHEHRYTILPPSPHPDTGEPYRWASGRGLDTTPAHLPPLLVDLLVQAPEPVGCKVPADSGEPQYREVDSPADWFSERTIWSELLPEYGWEVIQGDGDADGSTWRHPAATTEHSATVTNGCLFVYSTSTGFEPTTPGEPHGYTPFSAYAVLAHDGDQAAAAGAVRQMMNEAEGKGVKAPDEDEPFGPQPLDWRELFSEETPDEEWLLQDVLARGRGHVIYASHKQGKSLFVLWCAVELALNADVDVVYLDYEMTRADVRERAEDMGCDAETDLSRLHYYLLPLMAPLDTREGAGALQAIVERHRRPETPMLVVVDTTGRAVEGPENDADTVRAFYRWTGSTLKRQGVTWVRLDHAGKDKAMKQRGSSAKGDDVDVVWELVKTDGGIELKCQAARMAWVGQTSTFTRHDEPLRYARVGFDWPEGTREVADALEALGVPVEATVSSARKALREAGNGRRSDLVSKAMKFRREPSYRLAPDLASDLHEQDRERFRERCGTVPPPQMGTIGGDRREPPIPSGPEGITEDDL